MNKTIVIAGVAIVAITGFFWYSTAPNEGSSALAELVIPTFTSAAAEGEAVFNGTCAACHGTTLTGTDKGPPLLHAFYRPGHHGDFAIVNAVKSGSTQHHWRFGPMPAQPHITDDEIVQVIAYVREMQRANGFN